MLLAVPEFRQQCLSRDDNPGFLREAQQHFHGPGRDVVHTAGPARRALHRANCELAQSEALLEICRHRDAFFS
jgi:hypothetical protein